MKRFFSGLLIIVSLLFLASCSPLKTKYLQFKRSNNLKIVATTTMIGDMVKELGGNKVEVYTMMAPGVDPHSYSPHKLDIDYLLATDVVVTSGLHLEAKAGEAMKHATSNNKKVIEATKILVDKHNNNREDGVYLIDWEDQDDIESAKTDGIDQLFDPHFWFDVNYWKIVSNYVSSEIALADPNNKDYYEMRNTYYQKELDNLVSYIEYRLSQIPENKKILFTAHDAFNYFGNRYGFQVEAVKGISTEHEPSTKDIENLVNLAISKNINSVFIETSVPRTVIDSLVESAKSKGHRLVIGGELLSDSLGSIDEYGFTYIKMIMHNIDTIVDAILKN